MDRPLSVANMDPQDLGHGYVVNMANAPRFYFDPAALPPAWAQTEIQQVVTDWMNMVNGGGNNSNGVPIQTQVLFQVNNMAMGEIQIRWAPNYPVGPAAGGGMQPFPPTIYPDGGSNPVPMIPGNGPRGGRSGVLAYWNPSQQVLTFNSNVAWYMTTGNAANDNNPNFMGNLFDFYSTALHEWGHVLGLDHPNMPGAASTMQPTQPERSLPAGIIRTIDNDSLDGAKNLYTVNVCPPVKPGMPDPCAKEVKPPVGKGDPVP
jgi:hypothetical protein